MNIRNKQILYTLLICLVLVIFYNNKENSKQPETYKERNKILREGCHKYRDKIEQDYKIHQKKGTIFRKVRFNIRYNKENIPFIWCLVPKVGSTSWIELFIKVRFPEKYPTGDQGISHKTLVHAWQKKEKDVEFWMKASRNKFSFLITRHPFERLLSAYRDKFFAANTSYSVRESSKYIRKYGKHIIKKYRKAIPAEEKYRDSPTFKEFVEYVLEPISFGGWMNAHWTPMYYTCMPCHINYDIIGRKETVKSDSQVILKRIGIDEELPESHVTGGGKSNDKLKKYYSELDRNTLERLYKYYELDFLLFNYTMDSYYKYVS